MEQNEFDVLGRRDTPGLEFAPEHILTEPFGMVIFSIGFVLYMQFGNSGIILSS